MLVPRKEIVVDLQAMMIGEQSQDAGAMSAEAASQLHLTYTLAAMLSGSVGVLIQGARIPDSPVPMRRRQMNNDADQLGFGGPTSAINVWLI